MSFRERSAWVMMLALLVAGVSYFRIVGSTSLALGHISPPSSGLVMAYIISLTLIAIFGQVVIAALSPREAEAGADERDRLIAARAGSVFGHVLAIGLIGVLACYVLGPHGGTLVNAIEQDRYSPSLESAFRIARFFGVGVEDVFGWDG